MDEKIVFDMDDILWALNKRIADRHGIDHNKLVTYSIFENPILSDNEKEAILRAYNDPSVFEDIEWFDGADRIMVLEQFGARVFINSNCYCEEIARAKYEQIHRLIDIPDSQLVLNVFGDTYKDGNKEIGEDVFAFIDDSPRNLIKADSVHLYTLNRPWNTNCAELKSLDIKRFDSLADILADLETQLRIKVVA